MEEVASRLEGSDCRDRVAARAAAGVCRSPEQRRIARAQLRRDRLDLRTLLVRELEVGGVRDGEREYLFRLPEHGRHALARRCGLIRRTSASASLRGEGARREGERHQQHSERARTTRATHRDRRRKVRKGAQPHFLTRESHQFGSVSRTRMNEVPGSFVVAQGPPPALCGTKHTVRIHGSCIFVVLPPIAALFPLPKSLRP